MAIRNSIIFGGIDSADFGIYISGEGVFNAPKRDIEMIDVPGRNGEIAIDQGRWENIEVIYPAFNYEPDMESFRQALSDYRNAICSKAGYQRLTDTFHPDEYRMAIFTDVFSVNPIKYNTAARFDLKFNAKPQRWLISGETPISVADGDTLTNPTPYDASPLIAVEGYGTIEFNGYQIELDDAEMGDVIVKKSFDFTLPMSQQFDTSLYNPTDAVTVEGVEVVWGVNATEGRYITTTNLGGIGKNPPPADTGDGTTGIITGTGTAPRVRTVFPAHTFTGSAVETMHDTAVINITPNIVPPADTAPVIEVTADITITYTPSTQTLSATISGSFSGAYSYLSFASGTSRCRDAVADSSINVLGHPTYIDCEIGEAYKIESGTVIGLNRYIALGSDLPKLASGANEVTYDGTITDLEITPNWWHL